MFTVDLCPGTPKGSTGSGSGFKASQKRIKSFGITGNVLKMIKDFLSGRQQRVVVNGTFSKWKPVLSGIPHGRVLGSVLFLFFINDLPKVV